MTEPSPAYWKGRRVLVTGHTGFKGTWLSLWLSELGAEVTGLALEPETSPSMYEQVGLKGRVTTATCDVRDEEAVRTALRVASPEVIFHMAAQSLVGVGMDEPLRTFTTNVVGTANILESILAGDGAGPAVCVVVTSDKVYSASAGHVAYTEGHPLGGNDPYSASKAATEMVVQGYRTVFEARRHGMALLTARGGNVVGGGDHHRGRLVPDIVRSIVAGDKLRLRMPDATRPWQHVLDCLGGYILYAQTAASDPAIPPSLNFGPEGEGMRVAEVASTMAGLMAGEARVVVDDEAGGPESPRLAIDPAKARVTLGYRPKLEDDGRLWSWTANWYESARRQEDMHAVTMGQIRDYMGL